jgi:hypothetical protein
MSEYTVKEKVMDDIIATENKVEYNVLIGAQSVTSQEFKAISATPNAMVFNVVVPSLETILDRHVMLQTTLTLKINGVVRAYNGAKAAGKDPDGWLVNYGVTDALAPFPLNSIINNMQVSINNNTVSMQVAEILPLLLRMYDPETLAKYDNLTPTTLDQLADYADAVVKLEATPGFGTSAGDEVKTMLPASSAAEPTRLYEWTNLPTV